jgi:outer membrane protein assembly factor BamE (lipoprotein component of BamABCDE complex)
MGRLQQSALLVAIAIIAFFQSSGCSVYMEATRPTPVVLDEYQVGQSRDSVLERLGAPESSAKESDGANCDFYKLYTKGYGAGGKIPIAVAEGAADVFTLGLAEVLLTPAEGVTKNEQHPVAVCYKDDKLVRINTEGQPSAGSAETAIGAAAAPGPAPVTASAEVAAPAAVSSPGVQPVASTSSVAAPITAAQPVAPGTATGAAPKPANQPATLPE